MTTPHPLFHPAMAGYYFYTQTNAPDEPHLDVKYLYPYTGNLAVENPIDEVWQKFVERIAPFFVSVPPPHPNTFAVNPNQWRPYNHNLYVVNKGGFRWTAFYGIVENELKYVIQRTP